MQKLKVVLYKLFIIKDLIVLKYLSIITFNHY
jgi:hypothetical protein